MNTTLLFAQSDVRLIRKIATTFNDSTFDSFALEVQRNYLPRILSPDLYNDLLDDPGSANNLRLLNGEVYTNNRGEQILYEGLKVYLSYLWLYTWAREGNFKYSEVGPSQYQDDDSQRAANRSDQDTKKQLGKNTNLQGRETVNFLMDNRSDFPLYKPKRKVQAEVQVWGTLGRSVARYANHDGFNRRESYFYAYSPYYRDLKC